MVERRKRRKCADEEKIRIIAQARMSGVSVPEGTHRYDLNTNMVFKWIRDPWCNSGSDDELEVMSFLPVGGATRLPARLQYRSRGSGSNRKIPDLLQHQAPTFIA